jgi:DNA-binding LacI/PurR family transcriptional regulator
MPTLQDVARHAGVSTATVSKVLSNTPYFTEETRQKVMQAVEELGYVPNLAARALSKGKTQIIAVVFPYIYDAIFTDPLVLRILEGIESEATPHGYNLLLSTPRLTDDGPDAHYRRMIQSGYLDGVIALDNVPVASVIKPLRKKKIPHVVIGYHEAAYSVCSDDYSGGRQLMEHILSLGHTRLGVITVPPDMHFALNERMRGLQAVALERGIDMAQVPIAYGDFSVVSGIRDTAELLEQHPDITAIICLNDRMAMGAIQYIVQSGRRVPDDISVVGYDDIPTAVTFSPPLTTVNQHAPEQGQMAAQLLFAILNQKTPTPVMLPVTLIPRSSAAVRPSD